MRFSEFEDSLFSPVYVCNVADDDEETPLHSPIMNFGDLNEQSSRAKNIRTGQALQDEILPSGIVRRKGSDEGGIGDEEEPLLPPNWHPTASLVDWDR